jgi:PadR family transcriptional regulator, regulatory protein PadR
MKKGVLDALVLAILKEGDTYGYQLSERVSGIMEVAETALYPVLRRLEAGEMLTTYSEEHNGRLRRYYRITKKGKDKLVEYVEELSELERVIRTITQGGEKS